ncbi:hypothetical protein A7U60_g3325 [Sanghuangporus baumii]|uniref:Uncharacterized protein n=1 Tax=Sanghuangporus baumii TaxID=108892 RepID=A0A9Q5I0N9_SANBA|nr:hypothetical protein A7U60_g3325 [Sanghuangporus baumii]
MTTSPSVAEKPATTSTITAPAACIQIPKRKDSTETIKPSDSIFSSKSKTKSKPIFQRQYSAEGLWKAAPAHKSTKRVFTTGVSRSSPSSVASSATSQSHIDAKFKSKRTHKRSNAIHGAVSTSEVGGRVGDGKLSANYAAEEARQKGASSSLGSRSGRQAVTSVSKVNASGTLVEPQQKTTESTGATLKNGELDKESLKGEEGKLENASTGSRPPLRAVNTELVLEDEDIEHDSDGSPRITIHVEDASSRAVSPSEIVGDDSSWSGSVSSADYFDPVPSVWGRFSGSINQQIGSNCLSKADPNVRRVSLNIKPRQDHVTFWDVENGEYLKVTGRLEFSDLLHETYNHHAEIYIRSFVGAPIRGVEHEEEPEFTLHYQEPRLRPDNGPFNRKQKRIDLGSLGRAKEDGMADMPVRAKAAFQDEVHSEKDKKTQISTSEWTESVCELVPLRLKQFSIPIPAKLFETRETRIFRLEAKVSFRSKFSAGRYQELEAPMVQVSVSHLHSARELGIRSHVPARNDFHKTR